MNEEDDQKDPEVQVKSWSFCPVCGSNLSQLVYQQKNFKYCYKCGADLNDIQSNMRLPRKQMTTSRYSYQDQRQYKITKEKISDEEILDTKDKELWGVVASIGIPLAAFVLLNLIAVAVIFIVFFVTFDMDATFSMIENPYFIIFSSFIELVFILLPVLFVRNYLKNPSLKNRLSLLGFTVRGYDGLRILKEILIGMAFAIVGLFLVLFVSIGIEMLVEIIFGVDITGGSSPGDVEIIITSSDVISIILICLTMILIIGPSEEIAFRGFMQKGLVRKTNRLWGTLITAFIFSMIHVLAVFITFSASALTILISFIISFFPYFTISIMLGLIYNWRNENLIAVSITHGFYNAFTIIVAFILIAL